MKQILFCVLALLVFGAGIVLALQHGQALQSSTVTISGGAPSAAGAVTGVEPSASLIANLGQNLQEPLTRLFL